MKAPPNAMQHEFTIENQGRFLVVIVDEKEVTVRELGKSDSYKSSWKDVAEFVMRQQFFTFTE